MGTDSIIYIRADGNSKIATGHLVRCLSIAQELVKLHRKVCFLVSDKESKALLETFLHSQNNKQNNAKKYLSNHQNLSAIPEKEHTNSRNRIHCGSNEITSDTIKTPNIDSENRIQIQILSTAQYNDIEQELPELCSILSLQKDPIFFLDSYFVTSAYFATVKRYAKVVYLDDLMLFDYDAEMIINYDVIPKSALAKYQSFYHNANTLLLGAEYTPLRTQFQNRKVQLKPEMKHILITSGGSDPHCFCQNLVQYLIERNLPFVFHIVVGKFFTNTTELEKMAEIHSNIQIYENITDMATLMEQCDGAVSAAGTTLYELCALGIPTISFTMADNQLTIGKVLEEVQAIPYAGDIRTDSHNVMEHICSFLIRMEKDFEKRKSAQHAMYGLVDGNGAKRIAQAVHSLSSFYH